MNNPGFRSLTLLEASASTARVLNLRRVAIDGQEDREVARHPFFETPALNRSLIVKHHLRRHESDIFERPQTSATKVLLPIDHTNLKAGAKFFFIGQRDYAALLRQDLGLNEGARDLRMLAFLNEIPSFDPFLLREQLRRRDFTVASAYFNVSGADTDRMMSFAQAEIQPLVDIAFAGGNGGGMGEVLARKLLSDAEDQVLQPLRHVMRLNADQFAEGMFCWKAFLYYKWRLFELAPRINTVINEVGLIRPTKLGGADTNEYILTARGNIHTAVTAACRSVSQILALYDAAYGSLLRQGDGQGFRDFLLQAQERFLQLGTKLGAVDHIISFWNYRFPRHQRNAVTAEELAGIFRDFETSLMIQSKSQLLERDPAWAAA